MTPFRRAELPPDKQRIHRKATRVEWLSLVYLATAIVAVYVTLGNSQAMKAAWIVDLLSLTPPTVFLIASRFRDRAPTLL